MRRGHGFVEDAVLVLGGAVVIAVAWMIYWQAGLIVAGLVCMLMVALAYRHHDHHRPQQDAAPIEFPGAAAWRFPMIENSEASGSRLKKGIRARSP